MEITTREAARDSGQKQFFTGRACRRGHISPRYVTTGNCIACAKSFSAQWREERAGLTVLPPIPVHPDDVDEILRTIDFYNARRGLPAAPRPDDAARMPTAWEAYLQKEMRKPITVRPPLVDIERAGRVLGLEVAYTTMTRPVDTWSTRHLTFSAPAPLETQEEANARHNRVIVSGVPLGPNAAAVAAIARSLEEDGYAPDERPS